ncbi:hypothetical protein NHH03_14210 [Stieleria sp. TO1_6]|uniref:hypothetical protein n=1 Tax=Stieleria tagensis TaxID=2956795 RepID=UPI00209B7FB4|nr:hypothetical protein [Stieleria tagensis]MCO8122898.1 hypothetical protein [Stieleria tagensis]
MVFSLRTVLTLVLGFAVAFGAITATVSLPSNFSNLPEGLLFVFAIGLVAIAIATSLLAMGDAGVQRFILISHQFNHERDKSSSGERQTACFSLINGD